MSSEANRSYPEPVPPASQLAILPFLAAVEGYLLTRPLSKTLRITFHRVMIIEGVGYLQQVCTYLGTGTKDARSIGRIFPLTTGLMGAAALRKKIIRTRRYPDLVSLRSDLIEDLKDNGDDRDVDKVPISYLGIPILGKGGDAVLVLYADCFELNFFASDERIETLRSMCAGFCRLYDWIQQEQPFRTVRNFPLPKGVPAMESPSIFKRIHEEFDKSDLPRFENVDSFNYDAFVG